MFALIVGLSSKNMCREGKEQWVPFDMTPYCSTSGFDVVSPVFQEVKSALESMDISVEQVIIYIHHVYFLFCANNMLCLPHKMCL